MLVVLVCGIWSGAARASRASRACARGGSGSGSIPDPLPSHPELGWTGLRFVWPSLASSGSHRSVPVPSNAQPSQAQRDAQQTQREPSESPARPANKSPAKAPGCLRPSAPLSHPRHCNRSARLAPLGSAFRRRQVCIPKISPILLASFSSQPRLCAFAPRVSSPCSPRDPLLTHHVLYSVLCVLLHACLAVECRC